MNNTPSQLASTRLTVAAPFKRDRFTWLAYFMLAYYGYVLNALGPLMPFLRAEEKISYAAGSLHYSAFAAGMVVAGLTGDLVARRFGRRATLWGGAAGMALGIILLLIGRVAWITIPSALLMGIPGTYLLVMISATLSDRHGPNRMVALTEANVVASVCAMCAPLLVGYFETAGLGWRWALVLPVAALALLAAFFWREAVPQPQAAPVQRGSANSRLPGLFWAYWLVIFLVVSVEFCMVYWAADFLAVEVGLAPAKAASMVSLFLLAMLVGRFAGSWLAARLRSFTMLWGSLAVAACGFSLYWLAQAAPLNLAGLFIAGLGVANLYPTALSLAVGAASGQTDAASARASLASGTAILSMPLLLGWLADGVGVRGGYGIVAALLVAALLAGQFALRLEAARQGAARSA